MQILSFLQVVTTILEEDIQVVTATEIKTSSILVTPEPTWKIETVTIQPTQTQQALSPLLLQTAAQDQIFLPETLKSFRNNNNNDQIVRKRNNVLQKAQVIEIDNQPKDFKKAFGAFFANSAQRSANRFGDVLRPVRNPSISNQQDFDYYDDFDQQVLAAQNRPVFVQSPKRQPQRKSKTFTLYFSGTAPGDFSTKVTRLPVDHNGQPILSRHRREDINPSKVQPILSTQAPDWNDLDSTFDDKNEASIHEVNALLDLFSSVELQSSLVTVTETITQTVTENCSK